MEEIYETLFGTASQLLETSEALIHIKPEVSKKLLENCKDILDIIIDNIR